MLGALKAKPSGNITTQAAWRHASLNVETALVRGMPIHLVPGSLKDRQLMNAIDSVAASRAQPLYRNVMRTALMRDDYASATCLVHYGAGVFYRNPNLDIKSELLSIKEISTKSWTGIRLRYIKTTVFLITHKTLLTTKDLYRHFVFYPNDITCIVMDKEGDICESVEFPNGLFRFPTELRKDIPCPLKKLKDLV